jgi:hypothetical protein
MNWSLADFVIAGIILFGAGTMYEGIHTIIKSRHIRIIAGVGIIVGVSIIWVELAVGIFGTPFAGS